MIRSQREGEIARITVHMELSLNALIDRVQRQFAALMEQKEAKSEESALEGRIRICDDRLEELNNRLETRRADLLKERECAVSNIQHLGAAWVLPHPDRDTPSIKPMVSDPAIEKIAVDAVGQSSVPGAVWGLQSHGHEGPEGVDGCRDRHAGRARTQCSLYSQLRESVSNR